MKLRLSILIFISILLSSCNLTLAEDVTPPPGYIPPTPLPTLVLVPPQKPNVANGEAIYFEKCAPCHGDTGLGDGPQGIQLGVTVPAFALPEVARPASPSSWFTTVSRGRIDRFMPPFVSLNDQERWDVVAYIMTLHTTKDEINKGKRIFQDICKGCSLEYYRDLGNMSSISTVELARIVRLGNDDVNAFGENLSDEDMWAVAEYLRSLTYESTLLASPTDTPASQTATPSDQETPEEDETPLATEQAQVTDDAAVEGFGSVFGSIDNRSGESIPENLTVTLHGFQHDFTNPNAGTEEVITLEGVVNEDNTFVFNNVEIPENRIFIADVSNNGIEHKSDFVIVEAGQTAITLPAIVVRETTDDTSHLVVDELDLILTQTNNNTYELAALYTFRNTSEMIVSVSLNDMEEIPFIKFPSEATGLGYEAMQDSAPFINTADGFAMTPSETPYGILAFASVPFNEEFTLSQPILLPVTFVRIFVPDGIEVKGDERLTSEGLQIIQGNGFQAYNASNILAGETLILSLSGEPNLEHPDVTSSSTGTLLIGLGGFGLALVLAGTWMYLRDRKSMHNETDLDEEDEFDSADDVMDAIIALDDMHRSKKITDDAHKKRRDELKNILKDWM